MKIVHSDKNYMSGSGRAELKTDFDFCLFRQDWGGNESIYFNDSEIDEVLNLIEEGEVIIHMNYSIVYCKNDILKSKIEDLFPCYCTFF
jgi:hypothetical protein